MEYAIARGPVTGYKRIDQWTEVRGKRTRLYYSIQGTTSIRDLYLNQGNIQALGQAHNFSLTDVVSPDLLVTADTNWPSGSASYVQHEVKHTTGMSYILIP